MPIAGIHTRFPLPWHQTVCGLYRKGDGSPHLMVAQGHGAQDIESFDLTHWYWSSGYLNSPVHLFRGYGLQDGDTSVYFLALSGTADIYRLIYRGDEPRWEKHPKSLPLAVSSTCVTPI